MTFLYKLAFVPYIVGWLIFWFLLSFFGLVSVFFSRRAFRRLPWGLSFFVVRIVFPLVGVRAQVTFPSTTLPSGPVLYVSNHQAFFEIPFFSVLFPYTGFVAKKELFSFFPLRWFFLKQGVIPLDRQGGMSALRSLVASAQMTIRRGQSLVIFPEGTRLPPGKRFPFQSGVAFLYQELGIPVVPIAHNTGLYAGGGVFQKKPGCIHFKVLDPIEPGLNKKAFLKLVETRITSAVEALGA